MRLLPFLLPLLACSDYDLTKADDDEGFDEGEEDDDDRDDDDEDDEDEEEDDDECGEPDLSSHDVDVDEECEAVPIVGTFTPIIEWTNTDVGDAYTTPAVGQLTDDNGNGAIDSGDTPDVVVGNGAGVYYALSGDDGHVLWTSSNLGSEPMSAAIGDLDGDGFPEVVGAGVSGTVAWRGTNGSVYWSAQAYSGNVSAQCGAVGIWDLDADGAPEVVVGRRILEGTTGATVGEGNAGDGSGHGWAAPISAAADIDQDGRLEVVVGNAVYDRSGRAQRNNGQTDGYVAVGNFDGDTYGEIVVGYTGTLRLQDDDGTVLWSRSRVTGDTIGTPTVADFDGDGEPEIGVAGHNVYVVVEGDGTVKWSRAVQDVSSGFTGSSVFDFEGDGAAEVVYADENDVYVLDGATGSVKMQESRHSSATCSEYPAVADVDNDGHAEIIYTSSQYSGSERGMTVINDADNSWMPGRPVWNQHAYAITNVEDEGTIPAVADTNWLTYNNFRSGDLSASTGGALTDAVALLNDVCNVECADGLLRITVVVGNEGIGDLPAGVKISAYAVGSGTPIWLDTQTVADVIPSGTTSEGIVFELDPTTIGDGIVEFRADDDNGAEAVVECDEENNTLEVDDSLCE